MTTTQFQDMSTFLMRLARALHAYGTPSHRLEEALEIMSAELGLEAQYLITPTSIFASIGPEGGAGDDVDTG